MRKILVVAVLLVSCLCTGAAKAQFANVHPDGVAMPTFPALPQGRGPVAIGEAMLQTKPDGGGVALVQAPAPPSGGFIQLSAFGWLEPYADSIVQSLIAAFFLWVGKSKYSQWLDQSSRDALETFLKNRASSLIADGAVKMQDKAVHVDNLLLYKAANEASKSIPGAMKRFGLTPEVVAQKVIDAIPQVAAGASLIAHAHAAQEANPVPINDRPPAVS